ncbi:flavodoxin family protein [Candidatus Bathyarchaeota archaeon]|nr:flavodoxin family protein [Candidatus Bathyarchaeota archaeon]
MKLLAFNASPRKTKSATEIIMNRFIDGAKQAGADIERHYVEDLLINGCTGCFNCWLKTPGDCVRRDDMDWIIPKMVDSDIVYLGTPIYYYNIVHGLQRMRERLLPMNLPKMLITEGETHHPERYKKTPHTVLAAVCGFPDLVNFRQAEGLFPDATHIFLPAAHTLFHEEGRQYLADFLDAVWDAGYQLSMGNKLVEEHKHRLVVEYPDEVKRRIVEEYNRHFAKV